MGRTRWLGYLLWYERYRIWSYDEHSKNEGYCKDGDKLQFKVLDASSNELIDMVTDTEIVWHDLSVSLLNLTGLLPEAISLDSAYPNHFNPVTTLNFALPESQGVMLQIYDLQGRVIETLVNGTIEAGYHTVKWNADHHASGVYFVKMVAGEYVNTQKLMLLK